MTNFWQKLPKPFFTLAPMANVTDFAFRQMFAKYGKPDLMWTEFVSADGLVSVGKERLMIDLKYSGKERPIIVQLFTGREHVMEEAAKIVSGLGFDGIDINMGCPDRAVEKQGGGAAMMKNHANARAVLESARRGAGKIPVSIKTRIGYNKIDLGWIEFILGLGVPALTVHLRTRKEMSDVPAHWDVMKEIVAMRDSIAPETIIVGNGDIMTLQHGLDMARQTGCDGIMVGRGAFGKPWFFAPLTKANRKDISILETADMSPKIHIKILIEHAKLFDKTFKDKKNFDNMKKHFKAYISGWDGAKGLRIALMEAKDIKDVILLAKRNKA